MKQHPLSAAWPPMADEDFRGLVADIRLRGQRNPAYVYEDMVLDGWNRYRACEETGETFIRHDFVGTPDEALAFVLSQNMHRRHISDGQRANAVVQMHAWHALGVTAEGRCATIAHLHTSDKELPLATADEMAAEAGVSRRTIVAAKAAVANGLGDAVAAGEISVHKAARNREAAKRKAEEKKERQKSELELTADKLDAANYAIEELQRRIVALEQENTDLKLNGAAVPAEVESLRALIRVMESQARERMTELVSWQRRAGWLEKQLKATKP